MLEILIMIMIMISYNVLQKHLISQKYKKIFSGWAFIGSPFKSEFKKFEVV